MTGPEGEVHYGCWEWTSVTAPESFEVAESFANDKGEPHTELPTIRMVYVFEATDSGSRLTTTSQFDSVEQLEQLIEMGMLDGTREAMAQIEPVLADLAAFASDRAVEAQVLSDTHVRVVRVIRGTVAQVWRAHSDADLMKKWLLGPEEWSMSVCEIAAQVGDSYRYECGNAQRAHPHAGRRRKAALARHHVRERGAA